MTDLDKAREWAERRRNISDSQLNAGVKAVAEVIQSLPDQWIDAEKVRWILHKYAYGHTTGQQAANILNDLKSLLTTKLPTLADMTPEERLSCDFMQARLEGSAFDFVISNPGLVESMLWEKGGTTHIANNSLITPLTGEPKMQWPGSEATVSNEEKVADDQQPNSSETPKSSINPEDVPANEPWLIEVDDRKAIGTRYKGDAHAPWAVAALDGAFAEDYLDYEITLIHKLVPEPPALPEGMRLADHEEYGRVVVSPKVDKDGEYMIFFPRYNYGENGSDYEYAHKSVLTFLDGDQHA